LGFLWTKDEKAADSESSLENFQYGGFAFVRGFDILKIAKNPLIYSVSCFNSGAWSLFGGSKPTKAHVATGLRRLWTYVEWAADHTIFSY